MDNKFLKKVLLSSGVYAACLQHALTTEKEEVMGLLIGEIDDIERISNISACVVLHRSDKQPDRVEISPEQLCIASTYAEELATKLKRPMRVIGWYHSHPHITVWPSHVDVRTQGAYQMMDPLFVGLIFSLFQNDTGSVGNHIQVTSFQSFYNGSEHQRREIELEIRNSTFQIHNLENIASLPKILCQEEFDSHGGDGDNEYEDELAMLHNDAFKTMAMVHIVSKVTKPLFEDLEARLAAVRTRIVELQKIKKDLSVKLNNLNNV